MLETLLIASGNPAKVDRYGKLFQRRVRKIVGLKDLGITEKPEETGETAEENVIIKGNWYRDRTGLATFSEDESLLVDFLSESEQPGVHIRRINRRDEVTDNQLLRYWISKIESVPDYKRTGRWHIAYGLAIPGRQIQVVAIDYPTKFYSRSLEEMIIIKGWPLSSIQGSPKFNKPSAERTPKEEALANEERNRIILTSFGQLLELE